MTNPTANTVSPTLSAIVSPLWDKIEKDTFARVKTYGAIANHYRAIGAALAQAGATLQDLQAVVATIQAALPAMAEHHADKLRTKGVSDDDVHKVNTAGLLRQYQRDTHRNIEAYMVASYNMTASQLQGKNVKLAHYWRASGKAGDSAKIHAKPAPAKKPKGAPTATGKGKTGAMPPAIQPPLPLPQQADTLRETMQGLTDSRLMGKADILTVLDSAFNAGAINLADVVAWAQSKFDALEKVDAKAFAKQQKALSAIAAFENQAAKAAA